MNKTIVEKVIDLLDANGAMSLKEIYEALPEYTKSGIRGNINRYIAEHKDGRIKRIDKGVYSVIEIIDVKKKGDEYLVNYSASYYCGDKEVDMYHKEYQTKTPVSIGTYHRMDNFEEFEDFENDMSSVRAIFQKGDVRDALKRLKSESFNLLVTDPPYRVISGGNNGGKGVPSGILSKNDGKIFTHNDIEFKEWIPECYRLLKEGSQAYIFTNFLNLESLMSECRNAGFKLHNLLVWEKQNCTPNRWYMKNHEYILFCRKGRAKAINNKGCKTVHQFNNIIGEKSHETEKPVDLLKMYIENSSNENDWILDPFAGSGSTAAAALSLNRRVYTIELDDKYVSNIKERIKSFFKFVPDAI